jgi:hypothetical protein
VQNPEQIILTARGEADFAGITGGGPEIRLFDSPIDDGVSDGESFVGRKVFPETLEKSFEAVMMMPEEPNRMAIRTEKTLAPLFEGLVEEPCAASCSFQVLRIEVLKHGANGEEGKRAGIFLVDAIVEGSINVTVHQHGLDDMNGFNVRKSWRPFVLGDRNDRQQFRRCRCRNHTCFVEEILAYGFGELLDSIKTFEQRVPRERVVPVSFNTGDAQESGRAYRRLRLFRLLPRLLQKITLYGGSLPL